MLDDRGRVESQFSTAPKGIAEVSAKNFLVVIDFSGLLFFLPNESD
jgi:hypothetical protein